MHSLTIRLFALLALLVQSRAGKIAFSISFTDTKRANRTVRADVCLPSPERGSGGGGLDLFVFAHGGGLFAEDYAYLCDPLPSNWQHDAVFARLVSPEDDDPMDLALMATDLLFLVPALKAQQWNESSPLHRQLSYSVVLAGHSMGAAAALLAGSQVESRLIPYSILALAPGFWGPTQADLLRKSACSLSGNPNLNSVVIAVGDQDCANSLTAQALPIWGNMSTCPPPPTWKSPIITLAVMRGATHCQWPTPTKGKCDFDKPCHGARRLTPSEQQGQAKSLLHSFPYTSDLLGVLRSLNASYASSFTQNASAAGNLTSLCPCGSTLDVVV